ncbi:MAG: hypothetical protein ACE37B_11320 [Ilumatobacter sp.]|uniref:hypothetical protein n=1 Tax=Ilumatobacter sp. TaxID=1967498 RepID=UPI00391D370E
MAMTEEATTSRPAPIGGVGPLGLGETISTVIRATEGTCPKCDFVTLNQHSIGAVAAAAAHTRTEHPAIAEARYFFPEDAWQRIPVDFGFTTVDAVLLPDAGQLALFDTTR